MSDSPLFGTEALSAIAAGVPVLVSRYSGIARLLQKMAEDEPIVYGIKSQSTTDVWKDKILERLLRPEESQRSAERLREQLLLETNIMETHLEFINTIASKLLFRVIIYHGDIGSSLINLFSYHHHILQNRRCMSGW